MDFLKVSVIILFVILTILTIKIHPEIHQPMLIEDANFKLVRISDTITTLPAAPIKVVEQKTVVNQATPTKPVELNHPNPQQIQQIQQPYKNEQSQLEILEEIIQSVDTPPKKELKHPEPIPAETTHKNPYMTEQEEIIAWNKWRSNIQNQIMRNSDIEYAPLGTIFIFTFVVDKFGNVSNVKVTCSNQNYMDLARNKIKPAILGLQRKPVLNFPRGTQRTSTVVTGSILLGTYERYSTPDDYSDFEKVVN